MKPRRYLVRTVDPPIQENIGPTCAFYPRTTRLTRSPPRLYRPLGATAKKDGAGRVCVRPTPNFGL